MQQFRPRPRFDATGEAEPAEMPRVQTTDPVPAFTDPRFAATNQPPAFPMPTMTGSRSTARQSPQFPMPGMTDPRLAAQLPAAFQQPAKTDPCPAAEPQKTTAHLPIILLNSSQKGSDTAQIAALVVKTPATGKHPSLTSALQATMEANTGTTGATGRIVVIPGARKRKKTGKSTVVRHLNPRLRQGIILVTLLIIVVCTLTTLVPLSDTRSGGNLFSNLNGFLHSGQFPWDIQGHQAGDTVPTALNGPGLPYMSIANSPYVAVAEQDAAKAGIPPAYFVRQIQQESGFNPKAVSVTNAQGIAQFEPATAASLGVNPWDPNDALRGAARLMSTYARQYGGNYAKALGAYNAGGGAVQGAVTSCGMYWLSCMPGQTRDYVYRIMGV